MRVIESCEEKVLKPKATLTKQVTDLPLGTVFSVTYPVSDTRYYMRVDENKVLSFKQNVIVNIYGFSSWDSLQLTTYPDAKLVLK